MEPEMESNITVYDPSEAILLSASQSAPDRTGLFIALFLLFLLFILISYLFYSFLSFKRFSSHDHPLPISSINDNLPTKLIFDDNDDLINNNGQIILGQQSSFSDCGASLRSSSFRSHIHPRVHRSSSYKLCSQPSNYLLTPRQSSQIMSITDDCSPGTIIVEPNDIQLANALSRSISKYYERRRKPKLKRRTHSCEELMILTQTGQRRALGLTSSLPMRASLKQPNRPIKQTGQSSLRVKPTTIYELYKSDRMRIANLLVSDP